MVIFSPIIANEQHPYSPSPRWSAQRRNIAT
jgi:hypothetical protein